jgi:hypothetical protein
MNVIHSLIAGLNAPQLQKQISAFIAPIFPIPSNKPNVSVHTARFYGGGRG